MSNAALTANRPSYFLRTVILLLMIIFGGFMVSDMYLPALPHLMGAFHTTSKYVQLTITVYFVGSCVSMLVLGPLSDRIGRHKVILLGIILMIIGTFLCWHAQQYNLFLTGRIFQGLAAGAGFSVMRTVMRDMVKGNALAHVLAYVAIVVGVCPAAAPALGGLIMTDLGWRMIFLITLVYYLILLVIIAISFPETLPKATQIKNRGEKVVQHAWHAITHSEFLYYCICTAAVYAGLMAYVTASPMLIEVQLHYTPFQFGMITLGIVVLGQLSKIYNRIYLNRKGYRYMLRLSTTLLVLGSLSMLVCALFHMMNIYAIVIPMIIYSNGLGILFPNLGTAFLSIFSTIIGMASALYGTFQMAGGVVGSAIIAHFHETTLMPLSITLVVLIAIGSTCLLRGMRIEATNRAINQNMT